MVLTSPGSVKATIDVYIDDETWPEAGAGLELESRVIEIELEMRTLEFLTTGSS